MPRKRKKIPASFQLVTWFLLGLSLTSVSTRALVPLESLLLGKIEDRVLDDNSSPLQYLLVPSDSQVYDEIRKLPLGERSVTEKEKRVYSYYREKLGLFRGFIEEGFNLNNQCKDRPEIQYATLNDLIQAKRTYLSTFQYIGLDLVTYYLPVYAKYFDFSETEYENMVDGLIGNHCSQNITTVSLNQLRLNMMARFNNNPKVKLPSVKENPYFPEKLSLKENTLQSRRQEFAWTLELFKSFCSFGNNPDNYRLLVPLLRSPVLAAMVIRELSGKKLIWLDDKNRAGLQENPDATQINCQGLICRKTTKEKFLTGLPRPIGNTTIENDFERLYCNEFRDADYVIKNQVPKIKEKIKAITFDEQNLLLGQMIALTTGVPDFIVQADTFDELQDTFRASLDQAWDSWASDQNQNFKSKLVYEESLTVDVVPREFYFKKYRSDFKVELDVNLGEFDKINHILGKLRTTVSLNFSKKFLDWARKGWRNLDPSKDTKKVERIEIPFRKRIEDLMAELRDEFSVVPLTKEVNDLVIREILDQLVSYEGDLFEGELSGFLTIPVHINYGPFAMRHLRTRYLIYKNQGQVVSELKKLRNLRL